MPDSTHRPPDKYWLVFSYAANIPGSACANHIDDRLPLFRSHGIEPLLLSGLSGERLNSFHHYRVVSSGPSGWRKELQHYFGRRAGRRSWRLRLSKGLLILPLLPFYLLEKLMVDLDSGWTWFPLAFVQGIRLSRRFPVERIYTTGGSVSAHLAGGLLALATGIRWIAEFQDPLVHEQWLRSRRSLILYRRIERWICARADNVVFLTEAARRAAAERTELGSRGRVIYPGVPARGESWTDAGAEEAELDSGQFHLAHFGSLAGSRNPDGLLAGLRILVSRRPELRALYRLDLYGKLGRDCRASLDAFPWPERIVDHGLVGREEAGRAMSRAHVLLLIQNVHPVSRYTIPSKFYEYLDCRRIILGLTHENPELDAMLRDTGHFRAPADDPQGIADVLERLVDRWRESPQSFKRPVEDPWPMGASFSRLIY